jgi:hypothetical protein
MKEVGLTSTRVLKTEKYMEIIINGDIVKGKNPSFDKIDFTQNINIFYGFNKLDYKWEQIQITDFDKYDVVGRLINFYKYKNKEEDYYLRIIKADKNDVVDFNEEKYENSQKIELKPIEDLFIWKDVPKWKLLWWDIQYHIGTFFWKLFHWR